MQILRTVGHETCIGASGRPAPPVGEARAADDEAATLELSTSEFGLVASADPCRLSHGGPTPFHPSGVHLRSGRTAAGVCSAGILAHQSLSLAPDEGVYRMPRRLVEAEPPVSSTDRRPASSGRPCTLC